MTRRNNADRLGAPHPDPDNLPETVEQAQSPEPLSFIVPTEFVPLPSKGEYYPEGHILCGEETVEIKFMTAREEDLLASRSLLEKGLVLDRLIDSLLVDRKLRSRDLLVCDRNAILIHARKSGYGSDYTTTITCSSCLKADSYEYNLDEADVDGPLNEYQLEEISSKHLGGGRFEVEVPNSPVSVVLRLLNGHDERALSDLTDKRKKKKQADSLITDQLNFMIASVMDHDDQETIGRYVDSLPLRDSRFLRKAYEGVSPSITLRKEFVCTNCGYEDDITFPFTTDFFWPNN